MATRSSYYLGWVAFVVACAGLLSAIVVFVLIVVIELTA